MSLATYLTTIPNPMHRAKAESALIFMTRVNGASRVTARHEVIEDCVKAGYRVVDRRGELVLMSPANSWFDVRNITKQGLNYAAWLSQ